MKGRRPYNILGLFLLFFWVGLIVFSIFQILIVSHAYPAKISLPLSKSFTIAVPFPVTLHIKDDNQGIIRNSLSYKWFKGLKRSVSIQSPRLACARIELRLFGIIPFKDLSLNVLEQVKVIPSGHAIGVLLSKEGVIVVGMVALRDFKGGEYFPGRDAGLEIGDIITKINDYAINNSQEVPLLVNRLGKLEKPLDLTIRRRGQVLVKQITPLLQKDNTRSQYKLGLYIQDPAAGVGTMTFYEPGKMYYGALGHIIRELEKKPYLLGRESSVISANIVGIQSGNKGEPGEKIGIFKDNSQILGNIMVNSQYGIFGTLNRKPGNELYETPIPISFAREVHTGPAEILTVIEGQKVERFSAEIIRINNRNIMQTKSMVIRITDPRLLSKTGGIIQGMSGSPIIQDNQLAGAVTHVFVNDPTKGYGVFAEWMIRKMVEEMKINEFYGYNAAS